MVAFSGSRSDALRRFAEAYHFEVVYLHPTIRGVGATDGENAFQRFAAAYNRGEHRTFYSSYPFNVAPVTDDAPFFFSYRRWSDLWPHEATQSVVYYDNIIGTKPLVLLVVLVGLSVSLVLALVVWSLRWTADKQTSSLGDSLILIFFALIGVGFMFIEIPLIQHFVLLLGHPTYSMSITLPGILLGAALGSYVSGRTRLSPGRRVGVAVAGIILSIVLLHVGHEALVRSVLTWPLAARLTVVALITGVFGVFMGIPFPSAVAALADKPQLIALGWTVNGGTTVVASVVAIPVAMTWGFSMVLAVAAACYGISWLLLSVWRVWAETSECSAPAMLRQRVRTTV